MVASGLRACCSAWCVRAMRLTQTALFNFQSLLLVVLLTICTCTYIRAAAPTLVDRNKKG